MNYSNKQFKKIALLKIIFQCDIEKIKETFKEYDLDLKDTGTSGIYNFNYLVSLYSRKNITLISGYLYHYSILEKYLLNLGEDLNIKEKNSMKIFKVLNNKYSLFKLNNIQLEKLNLYRDIRNFISHSSFDEITINKINSTYTKLFKNNHFIINKFSEVEMNMNFIQTFIKEIEIIFIPNPIKF